MSFSSYMISGEIMANNPIEANQSLDDTTLHIKTFAFYLYNPYANDKLSIDEIAFIVLTEKIFRLDKGTKFPINFDASCHDGVRGIYTIHQFAVITAHIHSTTTSQELYRMEKPQVIDKKALNQTVSLQIQKSTESGVRKQKTWCKYNSRKMCSIKFFLIWFKYSVYFSTFLFVMFYLVYYIVAYYFFVRYYVLNDGV
jgi:hypothetical protein